MPVQGLVRLRKHLFGRQAAFGTEVAATRAYAFKGVPENELNWTDPDVDEGSLDPVSAPHREAPDLTASLTDPQLAYNTIPLLMSSFFGGQDVPTGGGTAKTWTTEPASETVDEFDPVTYEFGDDVLTDWFQLRDGILEGFEVNIPTGLGPVDTSMSWRFGHVASTGSTDSPVVGSVPTSLDVNKNEALVYGRDLSVYIADSVAGLTSGQIMDAFHGGVIRFSGDIDQKRYANGTQDFEISAYARATRMIEFEATYAKTADIVGTTSESDDWMADQAVDRYIRLSFTSTAVAQTPSTFYSWIMTMPCRYYTRTEGEEGGNSTVVLTAHAFFDPDDLDLVFRSVVVNTLTEADLGLIGS